MDVRQWVELEQHLVGRPKEGKQYRVEQHGWEEIVDDTLASAIRLGLPPLEWVDQ